MTNVFTAKLLQNLNNKKGNKGFTLIELLVVVIIIGVLAAVALPNLLGQVAKGRQSEARNNLGAINRTQQAHRLEEGVFGVITPGNVVAAVAGDPGPDGAFGTADDVTAPVTGIDLLPIRITGDNYGYTDNMVPTANDAGQSATAVAAFQNDILDYAAAVGQTPGGGFTNLICENDEVSTGAGAAAPIVPTRVAGAGTPSCTAASSPL